MGHGACQSQTPRSGMDFGHATIGGHPDCHGSFCMAGPTGSQRGEGTGCSRPRTRTRSNNQGGWTPQLPNSLEARGRASETEPDRLGLATDRHWIHAASARASRASRARVSDNSQARSSRQLGPFARCWRRIGSGQRADYWPAPSTRGPKRQRVPEVSCRGGFGVR